MFKEYFTKKTREKFLDIYNKVKEDRNYPFKSEEDSLIAKHLRDHSSYFQYWEEYEFDQYEWDERNINPFMHTLMHYIVESEMANNEKMKEKFINFFKTRKKKFMKHHDITHMMAQIIAMNSFKELSGKGKFEEKKFLEDLLEYSTWNKVKFWEEFGPTNKEDDSE